MNQERWRISRRTMLRGMGASIALPLLDAMVPARAFAAAPKPPLRTAFLYFPNGCWQEAWIPKASGDQFELPYSLEPLAEFRQYINILSNLDKANSRYGDGHYAKTANFLTGEMVNKTTGKDISAGGISLDQLIASRVGGNTPLPSLEVGIDPVVSGIDSNVGYTRLYASYISWRAANIPVAREINPRFVYERLFGEKDSQGHSAAATRRRSDRESMLDLALDDAKSLRARLGRDDQVKLDEYLESIHAVEKRIAFALKPDTRDWKPDAAPHMAAPEAKAPREYREHVKLMLDLMILAFQTDSTRVATFMFANDVSGRGFNFLPGVSGGHHDISHHEGKAEKITQYKEITRWHAAQFAYVLGRLAAIKEGEGTLLDNSMLMFGSSFSDGNRHDPNNLPIITGGKACGALRTGQHIASGKNTPLCNLYLTMLHAQGMKDARFGDSTAPIKELLA